LLRTIGSNQEVLLVYQGYLVVSTHFGCYSAPQWDDTLIHGCIPFPVILDGCQLLAVLVFVADERGEQGPLDADGSGQALAQREKCKAGSRFISDWRLYGWLADGGFQPPVDREAAPL
jgi:hypothetical protein